MAHEIEASEAVMEDGGAIEPGDPHYDPGDKELRALRSKEMAHDYRDFPEPDLEPIGLPAPGWSAGAGRAAGAARGPDRAIRDGARALAAVRASTWNAEARVADYFEQVATTSGDAKAAADWVLNQPTLLEVALLRQAPRR